MELWELWELLELRELWELWELWELVGPRQHHRSCQRVLEVYIAWAVPGRWERPEQPSIGTTTPPGASLAKLIRKLRELCKLFEPSKASVAVNQCCRAVSGFAMLNPHGCARSAACRLALPCGSGFTMLSLHGCARFACSLGGSWGGWGGVVGVVGMGWLG